MMPHKNLGPARRAVVYRDAAGKWRYRIQAANWKTIAASEQGFARRSTVIGRIEKYWPGVEIIER
jgi:uncharacterized protein YegP (UPF0339 family)